MSPADLSSASSNSVLRKPSEPVSKRVKTWPKNHSFLLLCSLSRVLMEFQYTKRLDTIFKTNMLTSEIKLPPPIPVGVYCHLHEDTELSWWWGAELGIRTKTLQGKTLFCYTQLNLKKLLSHIWIMELPITSVSKKRWYLAVPGWLRQLGVCLWLRSWSRGPRIKPSFSLCSSPHLYFLSQINKS